MAANHTSIESSSRQNRANGGCTKMPMTVSIEDAWFVELQSSERDRGESKFRDVRSGEHNLGDEVTDEVRKGMRAAE